MNSIKQLFCKHIWEDIERKFLRHMSSMMMSTTLYKYDVYAVHQVCMKCEKKRVIEIEVNVPLKWNE